jgi:hypothetical protein
VVLAQGWGQQEEQGGFGRSVEYAYGAAQVSGEHVAGVAAYTAGDGRGDAQDDGRDDDRGEAPLQHDPAEGEEFHGGPSGAEVGRTRGPVAEGTPEGHI